MKSGSKKGGELTSVDDYEDDEFDVQEESGSISNPQLVSNVHKDLQKTSKTDLVDFNLSTSLPPTYGHRRDTAESGINIANQYNTSSSKPLPENFALKLEESEQSINFEFNDSKTFGGQ